MVGTEIKINISKSVSEIIPKEVIVVDSIIGRYYSATGYWKDIAVTNYLVKDGEGKTSVIDPRDIIEIIEKKSKKDV